MPSGRCRVLGAAGRAAQSSADAPAALTRLRAQALEMAREEALVDAAWCYRIVPLDSPPGTWLNAGGVSLHAPRLLPESGRLTALACAVCTIGPALERRVRALFEQRRASLAIALDRLGNEALFETARRVQDRIALAAARDGLSIAGELRPGDPGLDTSAQSPVLQLADAMRIGCRVNEGGLLVPLKSTSIVLGVGIDLPAVEWSRCDPCPSRDRCRIAARRSPRSGAAAAAAPTP
ncbi:MAG: hypothetical protein M9885_06235 [Burkholderiaceae bacterium]|nr:hypothetical protein [Burkholderiaceae bacterium]